MPARRTVRVEAPPRRRGQWIYLVALAGNVLLGGGSSLYLTNAVLRAHEREAGTGSRLLPRLLLAAPKNGRGQGLLLAWSLD